MAEHFDEQKPHLVLVPFLAEGHITPLLDMARFIACRGRALVSFITTPVNTARIQPVIDRLKADNVSIRFIELEFPCSEGGLPQGIENLDLIPSPDLLQPFFHTLSLLAGPLELYIRKAKPSPSCMIVDHMSKFTAEVARRLDLPRFVFQEPSCFYVLCSYNIAVHGDGSAADESSSDTIVVPGLPQRIEVSKNQAPDWISGPVATRGTEMEEAGNGAIFNTFYELEAEFVELYRKAIGKPVWTMGPLALYDKGVAKSAAMGKKSAIDEHQVLSWLDSVQPKSVLLASFGSLAKPSQLIEVGCGLEASGRPFIWVIEEHDKSPALDKWMSEGFSERTKDRSLVITGWAAQVVILSHPSIGGFLTHCRWDSMLEAVAAGVPTITWPHFADQFLNEKLIVDVHDIGVSLGVTVPIHNVKEDEVLVKMKDVEKAISRLMDGGEECEARRARAAMLAEKAKKAVEEGGSSCESLEDFLEYIMEKSK